MNPAPTAAGKSAISGFLADQVAEFAKALFARDYTVQKVMVPDASSFEGMPISGSCFGKGGLTRGRVPSR